ncbi:hypothetical protein EYZ11_007949 [Aspergillus tanneri]|uniref:Major facilitator superfamily (MFS) profile domain-containing protein n=1 Tax=Aspergillus tanneri TaxID=1220188 RepID=A0A4S3JH83_9EURO|nr:hypothetical protein EYZ11_007949 [Aspergillus tanneri]
MLTSLCKEYYQFILAHGVLGGLTNGLTYTPTLTAVNQYFFRRRPLAMGIASSGSSLAGVIFPVALNRMLNRSSLGFGWSIIGLFLVFWAVFVPFYFIPGYAQSISITVDMSYYLISILNAGSLVGRLLSGVVANRIGRFNTLSGSSVICGILIFCWLRITSLGGMIVFSVLFGFFSGTVISLFTATIAMTAPKPNQIGSYMGMALGVLSLSGLTGTPITGAMIHNYGNYDVAIIFAGVASLLGAVVIFMAKVLFVGVRAVA